MGPVFYLLRQFEYLIVFLVALVAEAIAPEDNIKQSSNATILNNFFIVALLFLIFT